MEKLLVIADDFSGTLDTAIQFAKKGIRTKAYASVDALLAKPLEDDVRVYAVNTGSRHMLKQNAYDAVWTAAEYAKKNGVRFFYKKTDSALRGNVGAELESVLYAANCSVMYFAPAYPQNDRVTINGVQLFGGVPISETVYGQDPFEPVSCSDVLAILSKQSKVPVFKIPLHAGVPETACHQKCICVFDAETEQDLSDIYKLILRQNRPWALGGCAGFAASIANSMEAEDTAPIISRELLGTEKLLIVCGSLSPVSQKQIEAVTSRKIAIISVCEDEVLKDNCISEGPYLKLLRKAQDEIGKCEAVVIRTLPGRTFPHRANENMQMIGKVLTRLTKDILEETTDCGLVVFGGDTVLSIAEDMFCGELYPMVELDVGVPLSIATRKGGGKTYVVTKSGGFGPENILDIIFDKLLGGGKLS